MDRRNFLSLATFALLGLPALKASEPSKRLVLDYESKDPNLYRVLVVTDQIAPDGFAIQDRVTGGVACLDVKRAWILSDGRLELERYALKEGRGDQPTLTVTGTYTMYLDSWTVRTVDNMGNTIKEESR